jgi:hypothetical protein
MWISCGLLLWLPHRRISWQFWQPVASVSGWIHI